MTAKRCGIATLGNDKVLNWLLPFLESYRASNANTPLYIIPFDDRVAATRRAADRYGAIWVDSDIGEIDALAKFLYPFFPQHRRRLRKLQALALPLDEVIYLDADTILFRDLRSAFGTLRPGEADFVVASESADYVYNRRRAEQDFLKDAKLFNDGFFLTSRNVLSIGDFQRIAAADAELFHAVRKRGMLFAQPLVNFVVHRLGLKVKTLSDCVPNASNESFYKAEGVKLTAEGPLDWECREIYFAHWAGAVGTPKRRKFDSIWQDYARRARERMTV
ncbi:MAG TPA: hypothetical protein VGL35_07455 [Rhizomicrobium sp.]